MEYDKIEVPEAGERIEVVDEDNDELAIPENPIEIGRAHV